MRGIIAIAAAGAGIAVTFALALAIDSGPPSWNDEQRQRIASLSLSALPPLPPDPSNAVADDPAAAALGKALFSDARLSVNGQISCASCHDADKQFQDGLPTGRGIGTGDRRTMPIAGTAYSPWMFWDGRADSQWAQALGPLENPLEHDTSRSQVAAIVTEHYASEYEAIFGTKPQGHPTNRVFANVGKSIAAFERTIMPGRTVFDDYADTIGRGEASDALTAQQLTGLSLFIGKANCLDCHNGPLFTDNDFHNIGIPGALDAGRIEAVAKVQSDPFNCLGPFSDASPDECLELAFMKTEGHELEGAFRTSSLRGAVTRPPFMHAGQFTAIPDVLAHYNAAPAAARGTTELKPLDLTADELEALAAFLGTLSTSATGE
jgi:cytochrome c peroxidase